MDNQDELVAQFIDISGSDENVAKFYLSSSNWSLADALSNFLGNQSDDVNNHREAESNTPTVSENRNVPVSSNVNSRSPEKFPMTTAAKPRFATLNDMSQRSSDEEEGQAFYAGGSEHSGQQVLGPPKRKNFREQLTDMFRVAHEQSGTEGNLAPSTSSGANWGQGVRLGMTSSDHTVVKTSNSNKNSELEKRPIVILKLWSQGFSINDGELRLYDDPDNKAFLETVMKGEIPTELLEMGWMVNVDVEDHRQEDYKKKAVSMKTFKGSGHTLGSPAPDVENSSTPLSYSTNNEDNEKRAKEKLNLNTTAPMTSLQIRLADGSRLAAQFNLTHTVHDIRQYIENARPQYENGNYILVSSFPTREINDISATIGKAGLESAAIMQRLK